MWKRHLLNEVVVIGFTPERLIASWISYEPKTTTSLVLHAHHVTPLGGYALHDGKISNFSLIYETIQQFINYYDLHDRYMAWWCTGKAIVQTLVQRPSTRLTYADIAHLCPQSVWDYRYLYSQDDGLHVLYVAAISHAIHLQYNLLAQQYKSPVGLLTTHHMALLALYMNIYTTAYRPAQLAYDIARHNGNLEDIFTLSMVARMVRSTISLSSIDYHTLLPALGIGAFIRNI
jgi:hypothetical protein